MKKAINFLMYLVIFVFTKNATAQVYANSQTFNVTGLCIGCGISTPANSVDAPITNYETMSLTVSVLGANVTQKFVFPSTGSVGNYVGVVVENPSLGALNSTLLNSLSVTTFLSGVSNADTKNAGGMLVSNIGGSLWKMEFTTAYSFNQLEVKFDAGILGAMNNVHVYYAYYTTVAPLPIELLSFGAQAKDKAIDLNWSTASEQNNDHFTVEKSTDAIHYSEVTNVSGSGTSTNVHQYTYADQHPLSGLSYYRLKQTDFDGNFKYFTTLSVNYTAPDPGYYYVYPNPSGNGAIHLIMPCAGTRVKIINTTGQLILEKVYSDAGDYTEDLSALNNPIAPGMYFILFISGESSQTFRQIIQ
ncbi:MAG: hypothetical protein JWP12_832 [Bacteroidetes bacterium]|nr:hypothetical protein [Bacteroidota bacterium]